MAYHRIELPASAYERVQVLQHQVLAHEIEPEEAHLEMIDIIAPYTNTIPEPGDQTDLILKRVPISASGIVSHIH